MRFRSRVIGILVLLLVVALIATFWIFKLRNHRTYEAGVSGPPRRDVAKMPAGHSRDGSSWNEVPTNIARTVRRAAEEKYNLEEYWDPLVKRTTNGWSFSFQGTMPDPGFSFTVTIDEDSERTFIAPGM